MRGGIELRILLASGGRRAVVGSRWAGVGMVQGPGWEYRELLHGYGSSDGIDGTWGYKRPIHRTCTMNTSGEKYYREGIVILHLDGSWQISERWSAYA